jgi:SHS2 domain-containing protein
VEPKRPEEVDLDAPELDLVLVDFLTELLYRYDTRGWLTRHAELELHEKDGGWTLQGTWGGNGWTPSGTRSKRRSKR